MPVCICENENVSFLSKGADGNGGGVVGGGESWKQIYIKCSYICIFSPLQTVFIGAYWSYALY